MIPETPGAEQDTAQDKLLATAVIAINRLTRQLRWFRYVMVAITAIVVLLGVGYWQLQAVQAGQHAQVQRLSADERAAHADVITNCYAGNAYRLSDEEGWDKFLALALGPHPTLHALQVGAVLRSYIHGLDAPRDCSRL